MHPGLEHGVIGRGGTLQREGDPSPHIVWPGGLVNLVLFTVAKENRVNVRLKATKSNYCLVVPQSPCSWGRAKKARHLPPRAQKEIIRRVFPTLGLLGLDFSLEVPVVPNDFRQVPGKFPTGRKKHDM